MDSEKSSHGKGDGLQREGSVQSALDLPGVLGLRRAAVYFQVPSLPMRLLLFVTPLAYACFTSVFGMWLNLKFPNYSWASEVTVVKQGAASFISIFFGMVNGADPDSGVNLLPPVE